MRKQIVALSLVAALVGCTSDWDPGKRSASLPESGADAVRSKAAGHTGRRGVSAFAALPDRGELFAYDRGRKVRQQGAYTSHPVRLSEAHALQASRDGGELVLTAPDGETLRLRYDHHVEHPDGNWTWVGRDADGADAVLTFGEEAVFGVIPDGDEGTLRVITRGAGAWLVATDRSREPDVNRAATRSGQPDYLIPPSLAAAVASAQRQSPGMAAADVGVAAAAPGTIDLVIGYTTGYTAQLGGIASAQTRLVNLVDIANQALLNSKVARRLRLVRVVEVDYPDATENALALEELTGYRSGSGEIPVPEALEPLREARDDYGADLVALVRPFRMPENDGCGIAWLIGGGQSTFDAADAPFGYSVVSDGFDDDEENGTTYFCRDESLAHELGHNMGQAHNAEDSTSAGAHPYSYGYREASETGFYTVMAHRLPGSSQVAIRYFANPEVNYSGRATGVVDSADNTRSMDLTMPIVANFRATVVPLSAGARNDIDADGNTDLLFQDAGARQFIYRIMSGAETLRSSTIGGVSAGYTVGATGDVNGDRKVDLIWTSAARDLYLWAGDGNGFTSFRVGTYPAGWTLVGTGDIDGDGRSDLLFHNAGTRQFNYRIMQGASVVRSKTIGGVGAGYIVRAIGDFNDDGRADVVWTSAARDLYMWISNGSTFTSTRVGSYPSGWALSGAGDVDGDGRSDLLFRNPSRREFSYRIMNGTTLVRAKLITGTGEGYRIATTGDLNGDDKLDIVWTNNARDLFLWTGDGTTFTGAAIGSYPSGWAVIR